MIRITKTQATLALTLAALVSAPAAQAHHSAVMYDDAHIRTIEGTVKAFNWTNPHVTLEVLIVEKPGDAPLAWTVELTSPGVLTRAGWTKRTFNPGEHVAVVMAPLKDGRPGGLFRKATNTATGQVMTFSLFKTPGAP